MFSSRPVSRLSTQIDLVPLGEAALAEVGAEEAGAAGDDDSLHERAPAVSAAAPRVAGTPSGRPIET